MMDLTNPQIIMRNKEIAQLRAENARLKEELALSRDLRRSQAQVNGNLSEQLAKERNKLEMAEAIIAGFDALITGLTNALAALHEDRARECERLYKLSAASGTHAYWLLEEAAAHRARKQATKEVGHEQVPRSV